MRGLAKASPPRGAEGLLVRPSCGRVLGQGAFRRLPRDASLHPCEPGRARSAERRHEQSVATFPGLHPVPLFLFAGEERRR